MPYIYKITSPSGKIYIGSTHKTNIEDRWKFYRILNCKQQCKLYSSFKKYEVANHKFEIITECTIGDMFRLEAVYGEWFDVLGRNGLNLKLPNKNDTYKSLSEESIQKMKNSKKNMSIETRAKMSKVHKGKTISEAQRKQHSIAMSGEKHPMFGKTHSEDTLNKISLNHADISGDKNPTAKKVICTVTGKIWSCGKYAAEELGFNYPTFKSWLSGHNKNKSTLIYL